MQFSLEMMSTGVLVEINGDFELGGRNSVVLLSLVGVQCTGGEVIPWTVASTQF